MYLFGKNEGSVHNYNIKILGMQSVGDAIVLVRRSVSQWRYGMCFNKQYTPASTSFSKQSLKKLENRTSPNYIYRFVNIINE